MAREYVFGFNNLSVTGASTVLFIRPTATRGIKILRLRLGFSAATTAAMQRVQLVRQVSVFPTLTATTPVPLDDAGTTSVIVGATDGSLGSCGVNASAEGAGAKTVILSDVFNVIDGWQWYSLAGDEIKLKPNSLNGFGVFFPTAPATLTNWSASLVYRELGA